MTTLHKFLEKNRILIYVALIIYWITLILLTSLPQDYIPKVGTSDKTAHFAAYFVLAVLLHLVVKYQQKFQLLRKQQYLITLGIASVFGFINEFSHKFIPGRFYDLGDFAANIIGVVVGTLLIWLVFDLKKPESYTKTN